MASTLRAQNSPDWTEPFPPFRIAGNLNYVGSKGLANYLVTTPQGHILINSDLEARYMVMDADVSVVESVDERCNAECFEGSHGDDSTQLP